MKTLNLAQTSVQSKLILGIALLAATFAVGASFQQSVHANTSQIVAEPLAVQQIVIEGKRMTAEEKLNYDLVPQEIARVEIVGKRLNADEKLAMIAEDDLSARHVTAHRKV